MSVEIPVELPQSEPGHARPAWLRALVGPIKRAFVVHGDDLAVATMVTILREEGVRDVIVPREGESFPF